MPNNPHMPDKDRKNLDALLKKFCTERTLTGKCKPDDCDECPVYATMAMIQESTKKEN